MDYKLNPYPGAPVAACDWTTEPFYTTAIVLGIDIGIEGIGVWLRKGREYVYARTFLFNTPEAAPDWRGGSFLKRTRAC
jgi:hypothetical protein